ncbi:putative RNA polymerase III RPC4 [Trypanosoma vivax]|uniref:RNA polymerase III RPC4 n=1 Tax=Trypanosoma vivax (strain Y486) TaxID=1055687 RepID=G0U302_TRYVY|nr:hypothetical protein TRVL_05960 [Trypanosoma vivax]KAH8604157.1 putative RNA polymerase III RPC4 [Trypanosoma vivax]CCC50657.1 conserved hypothetical protein [Trypanosoma vivax Y486]
MPPKVPNLKFKPRHVVRAKEESCPPDTQAEMDNLSLVQLERLRLQPDTTSQVQGKQEHRRAARVVEQERTSPVSNDDPHGSSVFTSPPTAVDRSRRYERTPAAPVSTTTPTYGNASCAATLECLPTNTMPKILHMIPGNPNTSIFHPVPIANIAHSQFAAGGVEGGAELGEAVSRRDGLQMENDGTMFLRSYENELHNSRQENLRFEREVLSASHSRIKDESDTGRHDGGEFVWFQFPRFQVNPAFQFTQLPPGKVGEMKVYKSGRIVMDICGVPYDVCVEGDAASGEGACNIVSAVRPAQQPNDKARCYQLGLLGKKLVCTPSISSEY